MLTVSMTITMSVDRPLWLRSLAKTWPWALLTTLSIVVRKAQGQVLASDHGHMVVRRAQGQVLASDRSHGGLWSMSMTMDFVDLS